MSFYLAYTFPYSLARLANRNGNIALTQTCEVRDIGIYMEKLSHNVVAA